MYCLKIVLKEKYEVYVVSNREEFSDCLNMTLKWLTCDSLNMTISGNGLCLDGSSLQGSFCNNELRKNKKKIHLMCGVLYEA